MISEKTVGRLSLYRRLLNGLMADGVRNVYSHQLASMAGGTAAQVRRDLMAIGYNGSPTRGYEVQELIKSIRGYLDAPEGQAAALVGIGNLGRAFMAYFSGRRPNLSIVAAFDKDPHKVNRIIHGCRCYSMEDLPQIIRQQGIRVAVIAVPAPDAQDVANKLVREGVRGLVNFAPVPLRVPPHVFVEDIDMSMSLEKVAFFARQGLVGKEIQQ